jgi:pimeloyl-ACP methyl ester carboxylesterase
LPTLYSIIGRNASFDYFDGVPTNMFVTNGDARIAVNVAGDGADTIVLIHGFPLTQEIWTAQIPALAERMRVVTIDLRGMGQSSVTDGPYLMESLAGDVAAVLDALGAERATIAGHSLGGYVALAFARMYIERLDRLVLVCSRISADTPERAAHRYELADDAERSGSNTRIVREMRDGTLGVTTRRERSEIFEKFERIAEKNDPRGLAAMLRGMALRDGAEDIAGDVNVPVLVVGADEDPLGGRDETNRFAAAFPAGQAQVIQRSGHVPMLEAPDELTGCLLRFSGS